MKDLQKYITRQEAAEMLGVSPQTISNYISRGYIESITADRMVLVERASFERFVETYFDKVKAAEDIEKKIEADLAVKRQEVEAEVARLKAWRDEMRAQRFYYAFVKEGFGKQCMMRYFERIMREDESFNEGQFELVRNALDGVSFRELCDGLQMSQYSVSSSLLRSIHKMCEHINDYENVVNERNEALSRNQRLHHVIKDKDERIAQLEIRLSMYEHVEDSMVYDARTKKAMSVKLDASNKDKRVNSIIIGISARLRNALFGAFSRNDVSYSKATLYDILQLQNDELLAGRNVGKKTVCELNNVIAELSLVLGESYTIGCYADMK